MLFHTCVHADLAPCPRHGRPSRVRWALDSQDCHRMLIMGPYVHGASANALARMVKMHGVGHNAITSEFACSKLRPGLGPLHGCLGWGVLGYGEA